MTSLKPISPQQAIDLYVTDRQSELAERSLRTHQRSLDKFSTWCDTNDVTDMNELDGRDLQQYRLELQDTGLSSTTVKKHCSVLRTFLQYCTTIEAVTDVLVEKVRVPPADDNARDSLISHEYAQRVIDYVETYHYGSRDHVIFSLLWHTGCRAGTLRGIDIGDCQLDDNRIKITHRPDQGTPLKNGSDAERYVAIDEQYSTTLSDYIDVTRKDVEDEYGRQPLLTTNHGRVSDSCIRRTVYQLTRPCVHGDCPHDTTPEDCHAALRKNQSRDCPTSISTHDMRRSAITHFLTNDVPKTIVSDRFDVSGEVLDKHYDQRSEEQKSKQRAQYLDNV